MDKMLLDKILVFLVCCLVSIEAQFDGIQNFQINSGNTDLDRRRQLSPLQQGHILSDIQQHQHRFQLHQNLLKTQDPQKHTSNFGIQPLINQQNGFQQPFTAPQNLNPTFGTGPDLPETLLQPQLPLLHQNHQFNSHTNGQPSLLNPQGQHGFHSHPQINQQSSNVLTSSIATPVANQYNNQYGNQQIITNPTQSPVPLINPLTQSNHQNFQSNFLQQSIKPTNNPLNIVTNSPQNNPLFQTNEQNNFFDSEKQQQRLKELKLKQQIIEKHNQFVEKQYEKALKKAQDDHEEWADSQKEQRKKLYQSLYRPSGPRVLNYSGPRARVIFPEETSLFQKAVDQYYQEHPTTTTTTTTVEPPTSTTREPRIITTTRRSKKIELPESDDDPELYLPNSRKNLYSQIKNSFEREVEPTESKSSQQFLPTAIPEPKAKPIKSIEQLDLLQKQYSQQLLQREDLLRQLKQAIAETPSEEPNKNYTSREISLANGQTVQIIKTTDPKLIPGATSESVLAPKIVRVSPSTTSRPPKQVLDELTKGVLPPGADFEIIKHNPNGGLEEIGKLPPNLPNQKKVTFVLLEEQQDGSYKVQGVRGNTNDQKDKESVDVDGILDRIKTGEIKLPPSARVSNPTISANEVSSTPYSIKDIKAQSTAYPVPSQTPRSILYQSTKAPLNPHVTILSNSNTDSILSSSNSQFIPSSTQTTYKSTSLPYSQKYPSTTPATLSSSKFSSSKAILPTVQTQYQTNFFPSSTEQIRISTSNNQPIFYSSTLKPNPSVPTQLSALQTQQKIALPSATDTTAFDDFSFPTTTNTLPLTDLFKKNGLFAMAKFLKQSGLDTILNETGPYTIFVPTDKAFRNLLIQLGGPEKAEEKFKENPRLLSGLLLHHVIPGAFEIKHLQDEMTGVSLAGTQLRVNQYSMQDVEWNEVKVTTINGAKIVEDKQDIVIPQGIAHAVDRVMFPLPVGDIVQTLQSDRERRFTTFLRILFASGLAESLQGTKTYTVFAPVDRAFASLPSDELTQIVTDKNTATDFIMRHIIPGTLYTSGMRYYQIKESLQPDKPVTINKTSGRVKINNISMITQNVPSTNGVIHAMEALL